MNTKESVGAELITAEDAAAMLSMSVNAFRIYVHRYGSTIKKVKLGKRRTLYYLSTVLETMQERRR